MRARIPAKYQLPESVDLASLISAALKQAGLNPGVTITTTAGGTIIETNEPTIPAAVRTQLKTLILPLLYDTTADPDITV